MPLTLRMQMHATCLGMEAVSVAVSQNKSLLDKFDGLDDPTTVTLVRGGQVCWNAFCLCSSL